MSKEIQLLERLREMYLIDIDDEGQPKASIKEVMDLWNEVNRMIKENKKQI